MTSARFVPWTLCLLIVALAPTGASGAGDIIFAGTQVHVINIDFPQPAYWDSLTIYYQAGDEQYIPATVTFDGVVYDSVGIRFKGNASYTHPNNKKPFRLAFDEYLSNQRLDGLKGIHLNNCWEDPSFLREKIHLDLARDAGIPAPRAEFAQLSLNGELWGFYSMVEHVDKTFLTSRYGTNSGNLYKAVDGLLNPSLSDFKWYGADSTLYFSRYELKTDESTLPWTPLLTVIDSLNHTTDPATVLPELVNLPALYRAIGTDILMGSLDSYAGSCRNFYVYFNPQTGKMDWTLWDAGLSMGGFWGQAQNYETLSVTYVSSAAGRPLISKVFSTPELLAGYLQEFCSVYSGYFSETRLFPQIDAISNLIRPYVYADPRKMYTNEQFETNLASDLTVGGHRKPGLKSFITARQANVAAQLSALGVSCGGVLAPGEVVINEFAANNTQILDPAGEAEDWIEIFNNTGAAVSLGGMFLSDDPLEPTKWQFPSGTTIGANGYLIVWADEDLSQEGVHADFKLSAGGEHIRFSDGTAAVLDSVTFSAQTANLTMARIPNGTGPFVQGSPSFNARNGIGSGDVVINEFAASNTLIPDPAGDFEDWVELFNNTGQVWDLGGMYLSDDPATPTKWQFPAGTTIAAGAYLIVWADNEPAEPGLHASWKLGASGESVVLTDAFGETLDSITFGAQTNDLTMARVPNGTGGFIQGPPTFSAYNGFPAGAVVLNELAADNTEILDPAGDAEDWIEIHNNATGALQLDNMYLTDDPLTPLKWAFPAGTAIAGGGYLIVWADGETSEAGLHAGFDLEAGGEQLLLVNAGAAIFDSVTFGPQASNLTLARVPDGTGPWVQGLPTFNASNGFGNILDPGDVAINEFMASNTTIPDPDGEMEDWIELYNNTDHEIYLGGLYMTDDPALRTKWQIPAGISIAADAYLMVWADEDLTQAGVHANFKLSASGESIILSNPDISVVDSTAFGAQTANVSMARIPNGTGPFVSCLTPTPGAYNDNSETTEVVLPTRLALGQNAPNPFRGTTSISYALPQRAEVDLRVFDLQGRQVAVLVHQEMPAGFHAVPLAAESLVSGVYLYRLRVGSEAITRRMLVVK